MRILHLIDHFATGGAQVFLENILEAWPNKDDTSHVVGLGRAADLMPRLERIPGVTVERWCDRRWSVLTAIKALRRIRKGNYDVVHLHLVKSIGVGLLSGLLQGTKTVIHLHGGREEFPALLRPFYRMLRGGATRVIAVSEAIKKFAAEGLRFPEERICVIHNGVRIEDFQNISADNAVRKAIDPNHDAIVVGMVGRLVEQKGVDIFLQAFALVQKEEPRAIAAIVGGGHQRAELERLASELNCSQTVHFMGWREDIPACYAAFDIGVVPSRWEPFGIVTVEIMASGLPPVACAVDGIREIVNDGVDGLLVAPRDPQALAEGILRLIRNPDLRETLGRAARQNALEKFHIRTSAERIRSVYIQIKDVSSDKTT